MTEKIKKSNQSEKEDNRLPYEPPKLRKHGKVNDTTLALPVPAPSFDSPFGPVRDNS